MPRGKNSSSRSTGGRGNVQSSPSRMWFFTGHFLRDLENSSNSSSSSRVDTRGASDGYSSDDQSIPEGTCAKPTLSPADIESLFDRINGLSSQHTMQTEVTDSGGYHLQMSIRFKNKIRKTALVKLIPWGRWRPKGKHSSDDNFFSYSAKDDGWVASDGEVHNRGPVESPYAMRRVKSWAPPPPQHDWSSNILRPQQKQIFDLFTEPATQFDRTIYWFWEPNGKWGKSVLKRVIAEELPSVEVGGKRADMLYGVASYVVSLGRGPQVVIIDMPRSTKQEYVQLAGIEKIKDACFFSTKYESMQIKYNTPHVVCFANELPVVDDMSKDRWKILDLREIDEETGLLDFTKWLNLEDDGGSHVPTFNPQW